MNVTKHKRGMRHISSHRKEGDFPLVNCVGVLFFKRKRIALLSSTLSSCPIIRNASVAGQLSHRMANSLELALSGNRKDI